MEMLQQCEHDQSALLSEVVRRGSTFSVYISEDGTTWTQTGTELKIDMPAKMFAGLAVTAGNRDGSKLHSSDFEQVTITPKK